MALSPKFIIGVVIAGLLLGILLPIALDNILAFTSTDSTVQTIVATVLPIIAVISILLLFLPKSDK